MRLFDRFTFTEHNTAVEHTNFFSKFSDFDHMAPKNEGECARASDSEGLFLYFLFLT